MSLLRSAGGDGSGWFAEGGHVPGAQGGSHAESGKGDSRSIPKQVDAPNGTIVAKSKYGTIEVQKTGSAPPRYVGRRKSGENVGSASTTHGAADLLRKPKNEESFISGYRSPDVEWKWSLKGLEENDMSVEIVEGTVDRKIHLRAATGKIRTETYDGRDHLVVPVIACMEGVIHAVNAPEQEFVPSAALAASVNSWNGRPVVLGHPTKDGRQISANDPKTLAAHRFGTIFNTKMSGSRLCMEAWIDPEKLKTLDEALLERIKKDEQIEVSIGAHVRTERKLGEHKGKKFNTAWRELSSDHLAFLPKSRGACSIEMGCGALRAAADGETPEYVVYVPQDEELLTLAEAEAEGEIAGLIEQLRTAVGKRHSASDQQMLQTMHDHAVSLGATCSEERAAESVMLLPRSEHPWFRTAAIDKKKDCPHCDGLGQMGKKDCEYCDGTGTMMKAASSWLTNLKDAALSLFRGPSWVKDPEALRTFGGKDKTAKDAEPRNAEGWLQDPEVLRTFGRSHDGDGSK